MSKIAAFPFLLLLLVATAWAGETVRTTTGPRQEFRQRKTYPFVFEPVPYLENGVPPPLRFGETSADCSQHNPPPLSSPAKKEAVATTAPTKVAPQNPKVQPTPTPAPKPEAKPEPTPALPVVEEPTAVKPAYPAPENAQPVPSADSLDFNKYPPEVVDIFKNPYNAPKSRKRFFDPVFEPAQMPKPQPSKATYRQE